MLKKFSAVLAIALSGPAFAAIPLVTDDTGTQGAGGNQIEVAFTREKAENNDRVREIALVYTRGLNETLDLFIEQGRQTASPAGGNSTSDYTNTIFGAKWRAWENERKTSFGVKVSAALPVSEARENAGFGTGKTSYDATLILAQEMEWGTVNANLGAGREKFRNTANDTDTTHFSVAPVFNLNEQIKFAIDLGIDRSSTDVNAGTTRYAEVGVIYAPSETIELGLGYLRTSDKDSKDVTKTLTGGLTWRFK